MKNQNRNSFEEEWRNAFRDAEEVTDDALWTRLDSHLANKEAQKYKKEFRYFSIAATVALLLISLGFTTWWLDHSRRHNESMSALNIKSENNQTEQATGAPAKTLQKEEPIYSYEANKAAAPASINNHNSISSNVESATLNLDNTAGLGNKSANDLDNKLVEEQIAAKAPAPKKPVASGISRSEQEPLVYLPQAGSQHKAAKKEVNTPTEKDPVSPLPAPKNYANGESLALANNAAAQSHAANKERPITKDKAQIEKERMLLPESNNHTPTNLSQASKQAELMDWKNKTSIKAEPNVNPKRSAPTENHSASDQSSVRTTKNASGALLETSSNKPHNTEAAPQSMHTGSTAHDTARYAFLTPIPFKLLPVQLPALEPLQAYPPVPLAITTPENSTESHKVRDRRWWIGAAFSTLYFDPNFKVNYDNTTYANPSPTHSSFGQIDFQDIIKPDFSFLFSLESGYKLSRKWQIKSGLQYLYYNSSISTQAFFQPDNSPERVPLLTRMLNPEPQEATLDFSYGNTARLNTSGEALTLQNQYQYLSFPLQAGFILNPDGAFTLAINAGLAADLFLMNTIKGTDENVASANISTRRNSTYRTVTLHGLLGADIDYHISDRYVLSFQPLCRAALHSSSKPDAAVKSKPLTAGAGLGLKIRF